RTVCTARRAISPILIKSSTGCRRRAAAGRITKGCSRGARPSGEQAEHGEFVLRTVVHVAVCHCGNGKLNCRPRRGRKAVCARRACIQFAREVVASKRERPPPVLGSNGVTSDVATTTLDDGCDVRRWRCPFRRFCHGNHSACY